MTPADRRDAAEARELAPFLRALGLIVGPMGASLYCKPRRAS